MTNWIPDTARDAGLEVVLIGMAYGTGAAWIGATEWLPISIGLVLVGLVAIVAWLVDETIAEMGVST